MAFAFVCLGMFIQPNEVDTEHLQNAKQPTTLNLIAIHT